MATTHHHANRVEQLEDLKNVPTSHPSTIYDHLAAGKIVLAPSSPSPASSTHTHTNNAPPGQPHYIPIPLTLKSQLGSPTALAIGAFATTLTTLSFALMGWRNVSVTNAFIGDFFAVAGIGMVITAQWEMVLGNTYAYTVLSAFGLFYLGFGFIVTPTFGVAEAYGGSGSVEYNNAVGFFVLMWSVFNLCFLIGSLPLNLVYIGIFFTVQLAFTLVAASYFLTADGKTAQAEAVKVAGGACAFASGMLGYYTVGNLMCQEALRFSFPMGDTSRFFRKRAVGKEE
ncbi:Ylipolytica GPR1 protein and Fun34p [Teratosphaeria destructans]|uniref:Ylipolytica GPR1 protein and Fun34p n=1 Tax=Teratosphaeria destructans TaxID=418781 RepID=A0A9W7W5V1_9PEZI|nr:Ylipolytica GPR1 protein and Fun34p [Teratosphaeria destructans]